MYLDKRCQGQGSLIAESVSTVMRSVTNGNVTVDECTTDPDSSDSGTVLQRSVLPNSRYSHLSIICQGQGSQPPTERFVLVCHAKGYEWEHYH
jgi:hypothetical protein